MRKFLSILMVIALTTSLAFADDDKGKGKKKGKGKTPAPVPIPKLEKPPVIKSSDDEVATKGDLKRFMKTLLDRHDASDARAEVRHTEVIGRLDTVIKHGETTVTTLGRVEGHLGKVLDTGIANGKKLDAMAGDLNKFIEISDKSAKDAAAALKAAERAEAEAIAAREAAERSEKVARRSLSASLASRRASERTADSVSAHFVSAVRNTTLTVLTSVPTNIVYEVPVSVVPTTYYVYPSTNVVYAYYPSYGYYALPSYYYRYWYSWRTYYRSYYSYPRYSHYSPGYWRR